MKNFHPTPSINGKPKERKRGMKAMALLAKSLAGKPLTKWEQKFFNALRKPAYKHTPPSHNFGYGEGG